MSDKEPRGAFISPTDRGPTTRTRSVVSSRRCAGTCASAPSPPVVQERRRRPGPRRTEKGPPANVRIDIDLTIRLKPEPVIREANGNPKRHASWTGKDREGMRLLAGRSAPWSPSLSTNTPPIARPGDASRAGRARSRWDLAADSADLLDVLGRAASAIRILQGCRRAPSRAPDASASSAVSLAR